MKKNNNKYCEDCCYSLKYILRKLLILKIMIQCNINCYGNSYYCCKSFCDDDGIPSNNGYPFKNNGVDSTQETENFVVLKEIYHILKYGKKRDVININFGKKSEENRQHVLWKK